MPFLAKPECLCLLDFVCNACLAKEEAKVDPLAGYGYVRSDNDGFDGEIVTPENHKEEEFFTAAEALLETKES